MKNLGYDLVKLWIKTSLYLYHGKIEVHGLQNIPKDKPVLFLPNHQSALLDVLLIAVDCNRKPYFLTRSDVFANKILSAIFEFFQMIPIYRIRDGRDSLKNNQEVFDHCSDLLNLGEAILMFPEANHNLKRRVRPLSKGFTRILFNTLERNPLLDIRLVPVGLNYRNATEFPDRVSIYFGNDISVQTLYDADNLKISRNSAKDAVYDALKELTTHIDDDEAYEKIAQRLDASGTNYLNPIAVNKVLNNEKNSELKGRPRQNQIFPKLFKGLFVLLNLPMLAVWRTFLKPKVWEPEFMGTLRFAFALIAYPMYYLLLLLIIGFGWNFTIGFGAVSLLFLFNLTFVKTV